jgi:hypothetical protein
MEGSGTDPDPGAPKTFGSGTLVGTVPISFTRYFLFGE